MLLLDQEGLHFRACKPVMSNVSNCTRQFLGPQLSVVMILVHLSTVCLCTTSQVQTR